MNDIVLLNLRISMWGVSRVLPDNEYEVDADKAMVRATKKILECPVTSNDTGTTGSTTVTVVGSDGADAITQNGNQIIVNGDAITLESTVTSLKDRSRGPSAMAGPFWQVPSSCPPPPCNLLAFAPRAVWAF